MHEHPKCEHKNIKYCKQCDVWYCEDCKKERCPAECFNAHPFSVIALSKCFPNAYIVIDKQQLEDKGGECDSSQD